MRVTPLPLQSFSTPLVSWSTTSSFQATIPAMSMAGSAWMPMCSPSRTRWARSVAEMSAFEGMQPWFRQVPPKASFSTSVTSRSSCAARMAATYPPGPAPTTSTSVPVAMSPTTIREPIDRRGFECAGWSLCRRLTRRLGLAPESDSADRDGVEDDGQDAGGSECERDAVENHMEHSGDGYRYWDGTDE